MKKSFIAKLLFVTIVATNLSGCIIWPWWDDGHHRGQHGDFRHDRHGDQHDGHGGRGRH